ncbi:hypothetical protein [Nocardioides ochotonae]|uniref:hypothetical protein n=1 Tax=Nocardioides ochotonae TaxID=2685869 RepID=UPI001CD3ECF8|nr:hypothetical protein [Nocardioides ochotonae]
MVHARPEGGKVVPARLGDDLFDVFLALLKVYEYEKDLKRGVLGADLPIAPVEDTRTRRGRSA